MYLFDKDGADLPLGLIKQNRRENVWEGVDAPRILNLDIRWTFVVITFMPWPFCPCQESNTGHPAHTPRPLPQTKILCDSNK